MVNSSRKSSTQRCTTQKRQKSLTTKLSRGLASKPHGVEGGNGERGVKEHPRHIAEMLLAQRPAKAAKQYEDPQEKTHDEEDLPKPAQVEIFPALMAKPKPQSLSQPALRARILACEAAEDDDGDGNEKQNCERALAAPLPVPQSAAQ